MAKTNKKLHTKVGDRVIVVSGKDKGKQGNVKDVDLTKGTVLVDGVEEESHDHHHDHHHGHSHEHRSLPQGRRVCDVHVLSHRRGALLRACR